MYKLTVVDDEDIIRDGIANVVPWDGCGIVIAGEAANGIEALEKVEEIMPDIVITDINMDCMDGLEFAGKLKQRYPHIKVIILSGYDEFEYAKRALRLKVFSYLLKPVSPDELIKVVEETIKEIQAEEKLKARVLELELEVRQNREVSAVNADHDYHGDHECNIIDSNGLVVSARNPDIAIGRPFADAGLIETIQSENKPAGSTFSMQLGYEETMISYSTIGELKWYIVSTIPYSYLNSEASEFAYKIIVLTIAIIFIAIMFSFIISQSITAPLKKLEKNMIEFGEGKMNRLVEEDRDDEIGSLQKSFNSMSKDIKRLLKNIDEENRRRRITELKVLEYQINPHFLYNTLDSINWMALKAGHPDISAMVTALARFFRLGLSKGKELYTINDEIEHVHNYLIISTTRYKDCFKYHIDVDPLILELKMIKIILQPLVENAIKHGIVKNKSNQGLISIIGRKKGCDIYLEVADNGKGIDEEQLIFINRALMGMKEMSTNESGFGLFNVNQRIRLHYGMNYGLSIESQLGKGTIVGSMAAYRLVRHNSKTNKFIFILFVTAMVIPFQSIMIPMVIVSNKLGLINSYLGVVFVYL